MGGNLFNTKRISKDEYLHIRENIENRLKLCLIDFARIPNYKNKPDYGDLDILVDFSRLVDIKESLYNVFRFEDYVKNGNVHSIHCLNFQIDFINVPSDKFTINQFYYSYNDLGNLVGKVAKSLNCKYGNNGLYYVHYSEDKSKKLEVFLSDNPKEIYQFLDLDYETWLGGFDELEDIFKFVCSSKFFDSVKFYKLKHKDRVRDTKRETYKQFLNYIDNLVDFPACKPLDIVSYVNDHFIDADLHYKIIKFNEEQEISRRIKEKFNGKIVSAITGLEKKDLGIFMQYLKSKFSYYPNFVECTKEQVNYLIMKEFNNYVQ